MTARSDEKILIIGLGEIGYNNAEYLSHLGFNVAGYDISKKAVQRALNDGIIHREAESFEGYDYYIVCISTHKPEDMFRPYLDGIFEVARKLSVEGSSHALVSIESTITRGVADQVNEILRHRLHVVHCPHRYYNKEKEEHGVKQLRVLGGCKPCCAAHGKQFYQDLLGIPLHVVKSINVAELSKLVENTYRFMEIAFAEELKMVCDRQNISFQDLKEAVNTKWNTKILEAQEGIGGHCLPKDSQMFLEMSKLSLNVSIIYAAKSIDQLYREHISRPAIVPINTVRRARAG